MSAFRRRVVQALAALAALILAALVTLHVPAVQSRLVAAGLARLRRASGIDVRLGRASFNLFTLHVHAEGLTATAAGATTPFVTADAIDLDLPPRVLTGRMAVDDLTLAGLDVTLVRDVEGALNLPRSTAPAAPPGSAQAPFSIGALHVRDSAVSYRDEAADWTLDLRGLALSLERDPANGHDAIAGPMTVAGGLNVRAGAVASRSTTLAGTVSYDGQSVSFDPLTYESAEGQLEVRGRLESLWASPRAVLAASGTVALSQVSALFDVDPPAHGTVRLQADISGPLAGVETALMLESDGVSWRHIGPAAVRATSTITTLQAVVDALDLELDGGTMNARGRFGFEDGLADLHSSWNGLALQSLLGPLAPFPLAARLSGSADASWARARGLAGLTVSASNRSAAASSVPTGTVGIDGRLALEVDALRWRVRQHHTLAGTVELDGEAAGTLNPDDFGASPISGTMVLAAADLGRLAPLLEAADVALPDPVRPASGRLRAELDLSGAFASPTVRGELAVERLAVADAGPIDLTSSVELDGRRVAVDRLRASVGGSRLTGTGSLVFQTLALAGTVDFELPDVAEVAEAVPDAWRPSGSLRGRFDIGGAASRPLLRGRVDGADLSAGGQAVRALSADVGYEAGTLRVRQLEIEQPEGGRLVVDGTYTLETGAYAGTVSSTAFAVRPLGASENPWPLSAILDGRFEGQGTLERPEGTGHVAVSDLQWNRITLGPAQLDVVSSGTAVQVDGRFPDLASSIEATLALAGPRAFDVTVTANDTRVVRLTRELRRATLPALEALDGALSATVRASGTLDEPGGATVDVSLAALDLRAGEARLSLAAPARLRYENRRLGVTALRLVAGETILEASGSSGASQTIDMLKASLRGTVDDLTPWLDVFGLAPAFDAHGAVMVDLLAAGPLDRPTLTASVHVQNGELGLPDYSPVSGIALDAALGNGEVQVTGIRAVWNGAVLDARGRVPLTLLGDRLPAALLPATAPPDTNASLSGRVTGLTPAVLAPFAGEDVIEALDGSASLSFDLQADGSTLDRLRGTVLIEEFTATAAGTLITQARPTRLVIANGRLNVADLTWTASGNRFTLAGEAELSGEGRLDLRGAGRIDLRTLGAFVPGASTGGTASVSLNVLGTTTQPLLGGTIEIQNGELRRTDPVVAISEVTGRLVLEGRTVEAEGVQGLLNGGRFTANGTVEHEGFTLTGGGLMVEGSGVALNIPEGLRTDVDAMLMLAVGPRARISGRVTVRRGAYRQPLSLAAGLLATLRQRATVRTAGATTDLGQLGRTELEIAIANADDIIIDNNYGRMQLAFDVQLVGTIAEPSVVGRAEIREGGVLYLGGRTYQIERGTIDLINPRQIVPSLNLTARTRISGIDITLTLSGTPDTIRADLSSNPSYSQTDIVSLLATGRLSDQVGGSGAQVARDQLLGYLSGEALGFAAQAIGVDTLRFEREVQFDDFRSDPSLLAGETDPTARLTVSKAVTPYVDVLYSRNLRETGGQTWIVSYMPVPSVEVRGVSFDNHDRAYEVRHDVAFGRFSGPPAGRTAAPPPPEPRIAAVRFVGDPSVPADRLAGQVRLGAGDRFDFYRWQADRDRLRRFYLDRGFLEARVNARHLDRTGQAGEAETVLEYEIDRGPLASLVVDGYELPGSVRRELDEAWSNAIFDEARLADLRHIVRERLAGDGFLRAQVDASLATPDGSEEKRIVIAVAPGGRATSRTIRFDGRRSVPAAELQALTAPTALGLDAWIEPQMLAAAVEATYRQHGFLSARVTAGPVDVENQRATLPVHIDEGPAFTIAGVTLAGVEARPEAAVRAAFGITAGSRYRPGEIEQARRAVEADYARNGFNAVRASTTAEVDPAAATVELTLVIDEGPRQVLEAVRLEGDAASRATVTDALRLTPGAPVDLSDWYEGRRRVLDTGLFRRVEIEPVPVSPGEPAGETQPVDAVVTLDRWPTWRLRYGLDLTDETAPASEDRRFGAGLTADLQRRGFFGRAASIGTSGRVNQHQQIGRAFITLPTLFGLPLQTSFYAARSREDIQEGDLLAIVRNRTTFTAEQRYGTPRTAQVSYSYQFERNHTSFRDNPADFIPAVTAARLTSSLVMDRRNDPFNATAGLFHSSTLEYAPLALGSDVRFIKYVLQQFFYRSIGPGVVSASGIRLGVGHGFDQELLLSERFFAGGVNSVRGFKEGSLGPRDIFGDPAGGDAQLVLNQEVRFPIFRFVRGAGFADAGNIFRHAGDLSFTDLAVGVGAGLRFSTPIGLFRLDVAIPVSHNDGDTTPRWHFSFGQMF